MAKIIRGKRKGAEVTISQWANDWISTEQGDICNPTSLLFTVDEHKRINSIQDGVGFFWNVYHWVIDFALDEPYRYRLAKPRRQLRRKELQL